MNDASTQEIEPVRAIATKASLPVAVVVCPQCGQRNILTNQIAIAHLAAGREIMVRCQCGAPMLVALPLVEVP